LQVVKLELLAPARNRDIGTAAINCGADAVYIGGPSFGAREGAGNSMEEIAKLASYARKYGAKTYMTLNTILFQHELKQAEKLSFQAFDAGCDALIIQDMGLLKAHLAPLPLFASTQANIRSIEDVKLLESLGFKRVILSRELSLSQIREIKRATGIELESFIHGALCVSYSGQCYLSAAVTGRSANRGECAQPCRSLYNLVDSKGNVLEKNKAILSLKDLNLGNHIPSLVEAGITSFKIEGRLKNSSYVKNVVRHYRSLMDEFLSGKSSYSPSSFGAIRGGFVPNPEYTFNRGYTSFFIDGRRGNWNSGRSAKSMGEYIGKITKGSKNSMGEYVFEYSPDAGISNNDGLCFIAPGGKMYGARASVVKEGKVITCSKENIPEGSEIYRNYNHQFERELTRNMPERVLRVSLHIASGKEGCLISARCENGSSASHKIAGEYPEAVNSGRARNIIVRQLAKRSGIYLFDEPEFEAGKIYLYPASVLNDARRILATELEKASGTIIGRNDRYKKPDMKEPSGYATGKPLAGIKVDYRGNISNKLSEELYLSLGAESCDPAFEISRPSQAELMRCKYCIKFELGFCPAVMPETRKLNEPLFLENNGKMFRLGFDCKNCEMVIFG
jgi:putative protease